MRGVRGGSEVGQRQVKLGSEVRQSKVRGASKRGQSKVRGGLEWGHKRVRGGPGRVLAVLPACVKSNPRNSYLTLTLNINVKLD